MKTRLGLLIALLVLVGSYFLIFSFRSPLKDFLVPRIFSGTAREILPDPEPSPNSHNILLKAGTNYHGEILRETPGAVTLRTHDSRGGHQDRVIERKDIFKISVNTRALPVTASEIIAKKLFPEMKVHRFRNYSIFTNGGYSAVGPTAGILKRLYGNIKQTFPEIITLKEKSNRICVVVFKDSEGYQGMVEQMSPSLVGTVGIFSPTHDILFVNNDHTVRRILDYPNDVVRHEGAHQIFYAAGLHKGWNLDRLWLVEGLAVYSESARFGDMNRNRRRSVTRLINSGGLMDLEALLTSKSYFNTADPADFYDQSWALVYFLMDKYEREFKDYLLFLKKHPLIGAVNGDKKLLEKYLGKDLKSIEMEFRLYWRAE